MRDVFFIDSIMHHIEPYMPLTYKAIILLTSLLCFNAFSETNTKTQEENEVRELLEKTKSHDFLLSLDSAQYLITNLLSKVSSLEDENLILEVHYANLKFLTASQATVKDFQQSFTVVLNLSEKLRQHKIHALALTLEAVLYHEKDEIIKEINSYKSAINYAKRHNLKLVVSGNLNNLGQRYYHLGLFDQALKYSLEAISIDSYPQVIRNLAGIYQAIGELDTAEDILKTSKKLEPLELISLVSIKIEQGNYDDAKQIISQIRNNFKPLSTGYLAYTAIAEGKLHYALNEYETATELFEYALNSKVYLSPSSTEETLLLLANSYYQIQDFIKAANTYNKWSLLINKINAKRNKLAMNVLLAEYNLEREVNKKELAEGKLVIANEMLLTNQKMKALKYFITFFSMFITVLMAFFFYKKHKKNKELNEFAHIDALTQINNRRSIMSHLEKRISSVKSNADLCIAMLDIDHFKLINDNHGHDIGDEVLCEFSAFILQFLRKSDVLGRFGGEEFLIIFDNTKINQAKIILERLRIELSSSKLSKVGQVTFSAGLSQYNNQDIKTFIIETDVKLYAAKNSGRNQIVA